MRSRSNLAVSAILLRRNEHYELAGRCSPGAQPNGLRDERARPPALGRRRTLLGSRRRRLDLYQNEFERLVK